MLLAALKPLSNHPCPRCLVHHDDLCNTGSPEDTERCAEKRIDDEKLQKKIAISRGLVLKKGVALSSKKLKKRLDACSLIPIQVCLHTLSLRKLLTSYPVSIFKTARTVWR